MATDITFYYLTGAALSISGTVVTKYTGSGLPWAINTATPYRLAMNDDSGPRYTPTAAPLGEVFNGGPPFGPTGVELSEGADSVVETLWVQCYANSLDNAIFLVRQLRIILNVSPNRRTTLMGVRPGASTSMVYYEVYAAAVQESPDLINEEARAFVARVQITIRRAPFGYGASLTTLLNTVTYTNIGTGANNNAQSITPGSATVSDRSIKGLPMNIKITGVASTDLSQFWLASINNRVYISTATAKTTVANVSYGFSATNRTLSADEYQYMTRGRIMARFTTFTNRTKALFYASVYDTSGALIYQSPNCSAPSNTASFIDFGGFDLGPFRRHLLGTTAPKIAVDFNLVSTDGTSVTATLDYFEILEYYDFCWVNNAALQVLGTTYYVAVETVNNLNQTAYVRSRPPVVYGAQVADDQPINFTDPRGRLPRAIGSAQLYLAWTGGGFTHDKTNTCKVLAQTAYEYTTLRGNG